MFFLLTSPSYAFILNGKAALVGKTLITVQDAYFYRALNRFISDEGKVLEAESNDAIRQTVQKLVFEEMLLQEARAIQFEGGDSKEGEARLTKARNRDKQGIYGRLLKSIGRTQNDVLEQLRRSTHAEKFLQRKIETLTPIVTQKETELYYTQNRDRFKAPFESLKSTIELQLKKERTRKGLEEWIRFLRDKYGVVNYLALHP